MEHSQSIALAIGIGILLGLFLAWLIYMVDKHNHPLHQKSNGNLAVEKQLRKDLEYTCDINNSIIINEQVALDHIRKLENKITELKGKLNSKEEILDGYKNTIDDLNATINTIKNE